MIPGFLFDMAKESARRARDVGSMGDMAERVAAAPPPRGIVMSSSVFDVIAEAKLSSPSQGRLADGGEKKVVRLARDYESAGAMAVSVLTEETRFGGRLSHLEAVTRAVGIPVMRKDFLVDPIQVLEARASGASGVLLIARMLGVGQLAEMTDLALSLDMFVLLEVFDEADLDLASPVFDREVLIGVNCRDLATLEVDSARFGSLAPALPGHLPAVAESGIGTAEEAAAVANLGYRAALVGSALVASADPARLLATLIDAGRQTRAGAGK